MSSPPPVVNRLRTERLARGLTQAELAERSGVSRTLVTAVENHGVSPSVAAALSLAAALETSVEELFGGTGENPVDWSWPPPAAGWGFWLAEVNGRPRRIPIEAWGRGGFGPAPDGAGDTTLATPDRGRGGGVAEQTLVLAGCDPAAWWLAREYERASGFRLIVIPRPSLQALELLRRGLVHVAGTHWVDAAGSKKPTAVEAASTGSRIVVLRQASWETVIVHGAGTKPPSARSARRGDATRWAGREPGSGARQCLDELLGPRATYAGIAADHWGVADAVRGGWADAGVVPRLVGEEARLACRGVREDIYDLHLRESFLDDPRGAALAKLLRSKDYRRLLGSLPGYDVRRTGETISTLGPTRPGGFVASAFRGGG